jgi:crotonobetainyl-CoA:carnitine CoA-transferase CaiB-like acyl-CoA transferase
LIAKSDVVVENFRPGTLARMGLDYASLAPKHPKLIMCSISGFGQTVRGRMKPGTTR